MVVGLASRACESGKGTKLVILHRTHARTHTPNTNAASDPLLRISGADRHWPGPRRWNEFCRETGCGRHGCQRVCSAQVCTGSLTKRRQVCVLQDYIVIKYIHHSAFSSTAHTPLWVRACVVPVPVVHFLTSCRQPLAARPKSSAGPVCLHTHSLTRPASDRRPMALHQCAAPLHTSTHTHTGALPCTALWKRRTG